MTQSDFKSNDNECTSSNESQDNNFVVFTILLPKSSKSEFKNFVDSIYEEEKEFEDLQEAYIALYNESYKIKYYNDFK